MTGNTKTILKLLTDKLVAAGFRKARPGIFVRYHSADIVAWVGLNLATRGGVVAINPVVGVRDQRVEKLVAELEGGDFDEFVPPTAAMNVGYLTAFETYQSFIFDGSEPDEAIGTRLTEAVLKAAGEFVGRNVTVAQVADTLKESPHLMPEQTAYRLPVALLLAGRRDEAAEAVDAKIREIGSRTDPAAVRYVAFSRRFKENFEDS